MLENTQNTTERPRPSKWLKIALILILLVASYRLGFVQGESGYVFEPKTFQITNQSDSPQDVDYGLLWTAIAKLKANHIDQPKDDLKILYGAVKGAVSSVDDPYTEFFTPEELESFRVDLAGKFEGIGAEIGKRNGNIVVVAPLDGMPAQKAGLLPQDIIYKVDGVETLNWSVEEAVQKIRGPKGTEVVLTIVREGRNEPFEIRIKRDQIVVKPVKWKVKQVKAENGTERKVGILTVSRFGDDTDDLFGNAVQDMLAKGIDGLVLDLRSNPGGYLESAVNLSSYWLEKGAPVVTEDHSVGEDKQYTSSGINRLGGLKTITLINGGSASASEILAGALKDNTKTTLVGEKSFGKGSVQEVLDLPNGSALKVTIAKWITPGGRNLNKDGLEPDVVVDMTEEDYKEMRDPQMDKALELVVK